MIVGAPRYDLEAGPLQLLGQGLRIRDRLPSILAKRWLQGLVERDCLGRDDVHERATLQTWEDRGVDLVDPVGPAKDDAGAWPAQRLVGRGRHELCVRNRVGMQLR